MTAFPSCNSSHRPDEEQVAVAENEVYEVVVRDMVHGMAADRPSKLVFYDTLLAGSVPGADMRSCEQSEDSTRKVLDDDGSLRADTIQDFLTNFCMPGPLSQTFQTDLPKTFVAVGSAPIGLFAKDGSDLFQLRFPGAWGVISLSRVGFDSTLHEAIVSTAFECGTLCGSGHRYVLRKTGTHWEVVNKSLVWVS